MTLSDSSERPRRIVTHNVVHMFLKPTRNCEMVSQTLLGRTVEVLEEQPDWSFVQTDDTYRGWVESRWLSEMFDLAPNALVGSVFAEMRSGKEASASPLLRLPILCGVRQESSAASDDYMAVALPGGEQGYLRESDLIPLPTSEASPLSPEERIVTLLEWAARFLGTPYLWGGSSSFGLDCSGFVQICYRLAGITLRRDADIQRDDPRFVPVPFAELEPGDLVFFGKPDKITHVGMHYAGKTGEEGTFIHSAGGAGVIITPWGDSRYSPGYVDARRLDPARAHEPVTRFEAENR